MDSIEKYKNLIVNLPVELNSAKISKEIWKRVEYEDKSTIENLIFGNDEFVEISREKIFEEKDNIKKKIIMILMWGYPTGGRGNNIQTFLKEFNTIINILTSIYQKKLSYDEGIEIMNELNRIKGLGISTWTKLLYFFEVSIDSNRCQIFDLKIVASLNKQQFNDFEQISWKQDIEHYLKYNEVVEKIARDLSVTHPDKIELFLFIFNLGFLFKNS